mgnify:CR=1 FL=1
MPAMEHYFKRLIEIGIELSREKDPDRLLETILEAAQDIGNADAGTLFIRDVNLLRFAIIRNDSLEFAAGGTAGVEVDLPPLRLFEGGEPNVRDVACFCALQGETVNVPDVYEDPSFDFSGAMRFDELAQYRTQGLLTVPIKTDEGQVLGVVQLTNSHNPDTSEFAPFTDEFVSFVETIAMQAAVALQNLLERNRLLAPVTVSASRGQPSVFVSHASANNLQIEAGVLPVLEEAGIGYWYSLTRIDSLCRGVGAQHPGGPAAEREIRAGDDPGLARVGMGSRRALLGNRQPPRRDHSAAARRLRARQFSHSAAAHPNRGFRRGGRARKTARSAAHGPIANPGSQ